VCAEDQRVASVCGSPSLVVLGLFWSQDSWLVAIDLILLVPLMGLVFASCCGRWVFRDGAPPLRSSSVPHVCAHRRWLAGAHGRPPPRCSVWRNRCRNRAVEGARLSSVASATGVRLSACAAGGSGAHCHHISALAGRRCEQHASRHRRDKCFCALMGGALAGMMRRKRAAAIVNTKVLAARAQDVFHRSQLSEPAATLAVKMSLNALRWEAFTRQFTTPAEVTCAMRGGTQHTRLDLQVLILGFALASYGGPNATGVRACVRAWSAARLMVHWHEQGGGTDAVYWIVAADLCLSAVSLVRCTPHVARGAHRCVIVWTAGTGGRAAACARCRRARCPIGPRYRASGVPRAECGGADCLHVRAQLPAHYYRAAEMNLCAHAWLQVRVCGARSCGRWSGRDGSVAGRNVLATT
jgi:hypothetical protein